MGLGGFLIAGLAMNGLLVPRLFAGKGGGGDDDERRFGVHPSRPESYTLTLMANGMAMSTYASPGGTDRA